MNKIAEKKNLPAIRLCGFSCVLEENIVRLTNRGEYDIRK